MKVATTVFVGNISEKASDTLIRQILLVIKYCNIVGSIVYVCLKSSDPLVHKSKKVVVMNDVVLVLL